MSAAFRARSVLLTAAVIGVSIAMAGCTTPGSGGSTVGASGGTSGGLTTTQQKVPAPVVHTNVPHGAGLVPVDRRVHVSVADGTLSTVAVSSHTGVIAGRLSSDKRSWTAAALLEPGTRYTVRTAATTTSGATVTHTSHFRTTPLTLNQQTFPSIWPLAGQTVGIGAPVIVHFDVAVTDHVSIEKHLHVVTTPAQQGTWHWISDNEVHWRPKTYWKPGTDVTVETNINSIPAGHGIFGQLNRKIQFHVGASHIYRVNIKTDQLRVYDGGKLVRTIPVTTGQQPQFTTRSGIKVITEKLRHTRMNSETIGINPNSPEGYNLNDVQYAMRLTYSGEFLHAAPWSVYAQGHENVSHGCTGMSTANAAWLYNHSQVGDVVVYTGSTKKMTLTNGFGDWNEPYRVYRQGSALS